MNRGPEIVTLARPEEPRERLVFGGRVLDARGRPLDRAAVVAHQADRTGRYNPPASPTRVPRLRAVAVTDELVIVDVHRDSVGVWSFTHDAELVGV